MLRQMEVGYIPFVTCPEQKTLALTEKAWNKITAQLKIRHENPVFRAWLSFTDLGLSGLIRSTGLWEVEVLHWSYGEAHRISGR
jgi:hypothetical protein